MPHQPLFQYQRQASPLFTEAPAETVTLDKWEPRLPTLFFQKNRRPTEVYTFFTSLADLPVPTDWLQPITTQPAKLTLRQQPLLQTPITVEAPAPTTFPDWFQPISTPVRLQGRAPLQDHVQVFTEALPAALTPLDWLPTATQPPIRSKGLPDALIAHPPIFPSLPPEDVTLDKWYTPIQQPIFKAPPLRQSQIVVSLPESTFASVIVISSVDLGYTSPYNRLDYTTPNNKLDYTADDF